MTNKEIIEIICNDPGKCLVGEGPWVQDSRYLGYKIKDKYYVLIQSGIINLDLDEDSLMEIQESQIKNYIGEF